MKKHRKTLLHLGNELRVLKHLWLLTCKDELCNGKQIRAQSPAINQTTNDIILKCIYCGKNKLKGQRIPLIGINEDD